MKGSIKIYMYGGSHQKGHDIKLISRLGHILVLQAKVIKGKFNTYLNKIQF